MTKRERRSASLWAQKYWAIARISFQAQLARKFQFLTSVPTELLSVFLLFFFWTAVYLGRTAVGGFEYRQMLSYLFLAHIVNAFTAVEVEVRMASKILWGEISDVVMPLSYQWYLFAQAFSEMIVAAVVRSVVTVTAGWLLFGLALPQSLATAAWAALSLAFSITLAYSLSYLWGLMSFWTKTFNFYGMIYGKQILFSFLSGGIVPLALFPAWLQSFAFALPFQGIVHVPVSIYLGTIPASGISRAILVQAIWAVSVWAGAGIISRQAFRNLQVLEGRG